MDNTVGVIETSKGKIEFSQRGKGTPILMLHGSLQNCNNDMGYKRLLQAGYSLITPSRPGYGNTPINSGKTAEAAADLMVELLDYLGITSVNIMAASYGGLTGLYLASKYPDKVKKLILSSAISKPIEDMKRLEQAKRFYGKGHKYFWMILRLTGRISKKSLVKKTYSLFSTCNVNEIMKAIKPEEIDAIIKFYDKKPENIGAANDLEHFVKDEVFEKIIAPTLIIHSKEDKAVSFDNAENSNKKIRNSELFVANTWGHFTLIGKGSNEVLERIINFIS